MSKQGFNGLLLVTLIGRKRWKVWQEFSYKTKAGKLAVIPKGYITDFASVPRILWSVLPPYGRYSNAAVIHDFLYEKKKILKGGELEPITRKAADNIFREAMKVSGVKSWKRRSMYWAVRAFGGMAW